MHVFKDANGRDWAVEVNVTTIRRVRTVLSIDLPGLLIEKGYQGLAATLSDLVTLIDIVYVLCRDQAEKAGVTDEQFGCAMHGDSLDRAKFALEEELVDFFPEAQKRAAMRKVFRAARTLQGRLLENAETEIDAIDLDDVMEKLKTSVTASPVSSASTPDPSPSDSSTSWLKPTSVPSGTDGR